MINPLKQFYENEPVREAVREHLQQTMEQEIVNNAFAGKDVAGYKEAKRIIDKLFSNLEGEYGIRKKTNYDPS